MRKKWFRVSMCLSEHDAVAIVFHKVIGNLILGKLPNKITQKYCRDCIMTELHCNGISTIDDISYYMGNVLDDDENERYEAFVDIARQIEEQVHKIYKNK